jgi:hypothetical protein
MATTSNKFASNFYLKAIDHIKSKEEKIKEENYRKKQSDTAPYETCRTFLTPSTHRNVFKTNNCTYSNTSSARRPVSNRVYLTDH